VYKRTLNNPTTITTPNYSIVEDLSQTPCKMSSLEVLQSPPMQCSTLLSAIRATDSSIHLTMNFDGNDVSFHIDVIYAKHIIRRTVIDEGASTCLMSFSCWKPINSPELAPSPTLLTVFDGRSFMSHFLVSSFPFHLGGKTVSLEVEVVDAPLDNKLSLGRSWTYAMMIFISPVFQILFFSHEGGIVIVD
jgi:hypothetical protein